MVRREMDRLGNGFVGERMTDRPGNGWQGREMTRSGMGFTEKGFGGMEELEDHDKDHFL